MLRRKTSGRRPKRSGQPTILNGHYKRASSVITPDKSVANRRPDGGVVSALIDIPRWKYPILFNCAPNVFHETLT